MPAFSVSSKVKGTILWLSCHHCFEAEVRLYDSLWKVENPRDALAAIRALPGVIRVRTFMR